jgi:transposase
MLRSKRGPFEHSKLHSMSQITLLTGPERHRRWREEERQEILAAAFAPGASVSEVARRYDVATSLVYKWRQQALVTTSGGTAFTPAIVVDEPTRADDPVPSEDTAPIIVELGDGTRIRIGVMAPTGLVTAILRALR